MSNLKKALLLSLAWYASSTCTNSMETISMEIEKRIENHFHSPGYGKSGLKNVTPSLIRKKNIVSEEIKRTEEERDNFISILKQYSYNGDIEKHRRVKEYNNIIDDFLEYQKSINQNDKEEEIKNQIKNIKQEYYPVFDK